MSEVPRLHRNRQTLSLSFESSLIQSCMRLDEPDELVLDYTRTMMGGLMLLPEPPQSILMVGLGGGAMLKYLHQHEAQCDLTVVDINQAVIDLRHDFHLPPDSERLRIVCADGADFMARPPRCYDLILVDGFTAQGLPDALCSPAFYRRCRAALSPHGVMVANVQADTDTSRAIVKRVHKAFAGAVISVDSDEGGNEIVMAGQAVELARAAQAFETRWAALPAVHQATLAVSSTRLQRALMQWQKMVAPTGIEPVSSP